MGTYNDRKLKSLLSGIPEIPEKHSKKKKRPKTLAQIVEPNCTGCEVCIPFCPVDCIEVAPAQDWPDRTIPPVQIRLRRVHRLCHLRAGLREARLGCDRDAADRRDRIGRTDRDPRSLAPLRILGFVTRAPIEDRGV